MARKYPTVLDLVGSTPIVRLVDFGRETGATLLAKLEFMNPGGSNKDRIGISMIEAAERDGRLRPGGTIVEPTSGNTGVGLAIAAAHKGYRCIFVMPDKMSQEKISTLRAYGAEVVITPTAVEHDSPESYYSVSDRLAEEIPGGFKPDQYSNMANPQAHYETTAPELWEQTGGEVDAIVVSVGTGGSISGIGRYFKERKPEVLIVGADPEGSVFTADDAHPVHPYLVEGIGKDTWPRDDGPRRSSTSGSASPTATRSSPPAASRARRASSSAARAARPPGRGSRSRAGSAPASTVLMTFPDGGRSYLSKFYDDNWMIQYGFMERRAPAPTRRRGDPLQDRRGLRTCRSSSSSTPTRRSARRSTSCSATASRSCPSSAASRSRRSRTSSARSRSGACSTACSGTRTR